MNLFNIGFFSIFQWKSFLFNSSFISVTFESYSSHWCKIIVVAYTKSFFFLFSVAEEPFFDWLKVAPHYYQKFKTTLNYNLFSLDTSHDFFCSDGVISTNTL